IASLALGIVEGRAFPLWGTQSSVGVYLPPLADYLYALPLVLWKSPLSAVLFTGLLNLAGVVLTWWTARRYWGVLAGLVAGALFAANPWAVFYSRQIWQPDLMPPLAMACVATGYAGFLEGRRWAVGAHLALLAAATMTHFTGLALAPVSAALFLIGRRRLPWREVAGGVALGGLLAAPYALYLWRDRAGVLAIIGSATSDGAVADSTAAHYWRTMLTGDGAHALLGAAAADWGTGWFLVERLAAGAVLALLVGGALVGMVRFFQGRRDAATWAALLAALWAAMPLVLFTRHSTPVHLHYLAVALPAAPLLAGALVGAVGGRARAALGGLGGLAAAAQGALSVALLVALGAQVTPGGFGFPLGQQVRAAGEARALAPSAVLLVPGDNATSDEWAAVLGIHFYGVPHRLVDGTRAALFPPEDAALVVAPGAEAGLDAYAVFGAVEDLQEVPGRAGEAPLTVGRLRGGVAPDLVPVGERALLANGVEFLGYRLEGTLAPGETVVWRIGWRLAEAWHNPGRSYHMFNHLLDADGARLAQADGGTLPTHAWQVGDLVVQSFALTIPEDAPPGPYAMRVGMYTFPEMENQPLLDVAGLPAADSVLLGPLEAR
ncbi:MAG: hypothetical protein GX597_22530, partial [Anaerolineaceae bacterium]|nr:hypothetical protein [Anaerolineaceae bacterium]